MGKLFSFVVGGVVGATLGVLFAPRSGEETRAQLAEKADEYWGQGVSFYDQGKVRIQEGVANMQPIVSQKSDELREKIDTARTLIAEQVAKNAAAARDTIHGKVPVVAEKISQAADVMRGQLDSAASALRTKASENVSDGAEAPSGLTSAAAVAAAAAAPGTPGVAAGVPAAAAAPAPAPAVAPAPAPAPAAAPAAAPDKIEPQ